MIEDVVTLLRCPVCGGALSVQGRTLRCPAGHSYDLARQGYVNLLASRGNASGDTADMVAARDRFLTAGHYAPIADVVCRSVAEAAPAGPVLDLGAGTGWYLAHVLDHLDGRGRPESGLAIDVSPYAARRAARCHPRAGAVVCDTWRPLPVADACVGVVLDVFAPRNPAEVRRVLRPGGVLVVVTPTAEHLAELRGPLGLLDVQGDKQERLDASLEGRFEPVARRGVDVALRLRRRDVADLVAMGPSAWHDPDGTRDRLVVGLPEPIAVTASVHVAAYRRR